MAAIGFVTHTQREQANSLAQETAAWLRHQGHRTEFLDAIPPPGAPRNGQQPEPLDLAVSVGGDGTMLRTVDLVSPLGVPVLGVNMGHLGYLAAVEPSDSAPPCTLLDRRLRGGIPVDPGRLGDR